ncbi:MAG: HlyD family secretion protein [Ruegeria sp.]
MLIVLAIYCFFVWLLFFKLNLLPWGRMSKTIVGLIGLAIVLVVLALLNSRTPSGRFAVMAPVVEVAPIVSGTISEVPAEPNIRVEQGDVLLRLDKRPFEYSRDLAKANFDIAQKTYDRRLGAYEVNKATVSEQAVDESLSALQAAEARLRLAEYDLDHTDVLAPTAGVVTGVRVSIGDQVRAMTGVMPLIRSDAKILAGVFKQNGSGAIVPGAEVGLTFDNNPGLIYWTTVKEITNGTSGGQTQIDATLLDASDVGSTSELLVNLNWPDDVTNSDYVLGSIGAATVFDENAGAMGVLAKVLLWIKAYVAYL